jgi:hypothetical protein
MTMRPAGTTDSRVPECASPNPASGVSHTAGTEAFAIAADWAR